MTVEIDSETYEVRRLLDERGAEYVTCDEPSMWYTCWRLAGDDMMNACFEEIDGLVPSFYIRYATPKQAIEATLGPGECHNASEYPRMFFCCSECGCSHKRNRAYVDMPRFCPNCGRKVVYE